MNTRTGSKKGEGGAVEARIQSIGRAKALLDAMADGEWIGLRDLAAQTGLVKTTAFNLVNALADVGLVEHDPEVGAYRLGLHHVVYGRAVERRLDILTIAKPHLVKLCTATRETVNLALPGPGEATIVESLEGSHNLRVTSYSGTAASYHATACGRALLAYQPESFRQMVYSMGTLNKITEKTIIDPQELEQLLEQCRTRGWTLEVEENEPGSACIAAPIFDMTGKAVASVSVAGPAARFHPEAAENLARMLVEHLSRISEDLGRPRTPAEVPDGKGRRAGPR
ncbi:IclR family transcriptional regulator [Frigidibacter sp. ROC022]|uniref:IclR family transcriptional regulator n=1 Tax=Frigidibacter sp. ROC022 TaxID=2971796 RepID=UPI00215A8CEF|nr:IclR family transcriptional regulator [Frigidibacter sp. ROC022]MCR8726054.1 IclR family transcriptional regulator [Frigidibacter sp. ROC022]